MAVNMITVMGTAVWQLVQDKLITEATLHDVVDDLRALDYSQSIGSFLATQGVIKTEAVEPALHSHTY